MMMIIIIIVIIIITSYKSQGYLAEHKCFTYWGDWKSNQIKGNQVKCWFFEERGKPEYPEKNLSEQSREPTNSTHMSHRVRESIPGHIGGRWVLSLLRQLCSNSVPPFYPSAISLLVWRREDWFLFPSATAFWNLRTFQPSRFIGYLWRTFLNSVNNIAPVSKWRNYEL